MNEMKNVMTTSSENTSRYFEETIFVHAKQQCPLFYVHNLFGLQYKKL